MVVRGSQASLNDVVAVSQNSDQGGSGWCRCCSDVLEGLEGGELNDTFHIAKGLDQGVDRNGTSGRDFTKHLQVRCPTLGGWKEVHGRLVFSLSADLLPRDREGRQDQAPVKLGSPMMYGGVIPTKLRIGNAVDAQDIGGVLGCGIAVIVDLAIEEPSIQFPRDIGHCRFPLIDGAGNQPAIVRAAIETVANFVSSGTPTLVACGAGMSRSLAIVAAATTATERITPMEALVKLMARGSARSRVAGAAARHRRSLQAHRHRSLRDWECAPAQPVTPAGK